MSEKTYHPADLLSHGSLRGLVEAARAKMKEDEGLTTLEAMVEALDNEDKEVAHE